MKQQPQFTSASPHLGDHSANQYDLNYSLDAPYVAAVYTFFRCHYCRKVYAGLPQFGEWWLYSREDAGDPQKVGSPISKQAAQWPMCIDAKCLRENGPQEMFLMDGGAAVIVTKEGDWLFLGRMGGG